jgi:hypothetical protein
MVTPFPDKEYPTVIGIDFGKTHMKYATKRKKTTDLITQVPLSLVPRMPI